MSINLKDLSQDSATALIVVDMQPDFYPKGALAVKGGDEIVDSISRLVVQFQTVVFSQDSHPEIHISFASSYPTKKEFDILSLAEVKTGRISSPHFSQQVLEDYLNRVSSREQVLWPEHCIMGSKNWELDSRLPLERASIILRKGTTPAVDSYSVFYENDGSSTGLGALLREREIKRVILCGLAGDYCVYWSAKDAVRGGFKVVYDEALTRFVNFPEKSRERAIEDLQARGVEFVRLS